MTSPYGTDGVTHIAGYDSLDGIDYAALFNAEPTPSAVFSRT